MRAEEEIPDPTVITQVENASDPAAQPPISFLKTWITAEAKAKSANSQTTQTHTENTVKNPPPEPRSQTNKPTRSSNQA
jgi:hypothetical protein